MEGHLRVSSTNKAGKPQWDNATQPPICLDLHCVEKVLFVIFKGKDNRHLQDKDSNQKLTQEEIEQMKKEGVSGDVRAYCFNPVFLMLTLTLTQHHYLCLLFIELH
jgi:hypothetical protein